MILFTVITRSQYPGRYFSNLHSYSGALPYSLIIHVVFAYEVACILPLIERIET